MEITYTNTRCRPGAESSEDRDRNDEDAPGSCVLRRTAPTSGWVKRYYISNDEGYLVPATTVTVNGETTYTITPGGTTPTFELRVGTYTLTDGKAPDG
jgi:hypothetical protein